MWRYVALCGAIPQFEKANFSQFLSFWLFSGHLQKQWWHYVALCGAMWRYPAIRKRQASLNFCLFGCFQDISKNSGGTMWRYVALCGAIPQFEKANFSRFLSFWLFSGHLQKQWWHYVALCGAIPQFEKGKFLSIFVFLAVFRTSPKTVVALCGAMWRYPAIRKRQASLNFCLFGCFQDISKHSGGTMWRYVTLCGAIPQFKKGKLLSIFVFLAVFRTSPKTVVALCGPMWPYEALCPYVALCGTIPKVEKHMFSFFLLLLLFWKKLKKNLRRAVWRYPRLPARRAEGEEQERMQKRMKTMDEDWCKKWYMKVLKVESWWW